MTGGSRLELFSWLTPWHIESTTWSVYLDKGTRFHIWACGKDHLRMVAANSKQNDLNVECEPRPKVRLEKKKMLGTVGTIYHKSWISFTISAAGLAGGVYGFRTSEEQSLRLRRCRFESSPKETTESIPVSVPWSWDKDKQHQPKDDQHVLSSNFYQVASHRIVCTCKAILIILHYCHQKKLPTSSWTHLLIRKCPPKTFLLDSFSLPTTMRCSGCVSMNRIWQRNSEILKNHQRSTKSKSNLATSKKPLWWSKNIHRPMSVSY